MRAVQRFEVSLKVFIVREGAALLVREADTGFWELPGGRIDVGEEWDQHSEVLAREVREELGPDVRIDVSQRSFSWVRQRPTDGQHLFIVARPAVLLSGAPRLSPEHSELAWLKPDDWQELAFPPQSAYRDALQRLWDLSRN